MSFLSVLGFLFIFLGSVKAQDLTHRMTPERAWEATLSSAAKDRNGAFFSPEENKVFALTDDGTVSAFEGPTGQLLWSEPVPFAVDDCQSGITFSYNNDQGIEDYLVFSTIEFDALSGLEFTRVIGRRISDGSLLFASTLLPGIGATPQVTLDGRHIVITHNSPAADDVTDFAIGHFSMIDILNENTTDTTFPPIFTYVNTTNPFGEVGVVFNPSSSVYTADDGNDVNNDNDVFLFAFKARDNGAGLAVNSVGQIFAVQLPRLYRFDGEGINVYPAGSRNIQSSERPYAFEGNIYWGINRGSIRAWVDTPIDNAETADLGYGRGNPTFIASRAPPVAIDFNNEIGVYMPTAPNGLMYANEDFSADLFFATPAPIFSRPVVSPDHEYVYAVTEDGLMYQLSAKTLIQGWTAFTFWNDVFGDLAISRDGGLVYVVDSFNNGSSGKIVALRVADVTTQAPSSSPTAPPTTAPSNSPTLSSMPSPLFVGPTAIPSEQPSTAPVPVPSDAPSSTPSGIPTLSPSSSPTAVPSSLPTRAPVIGTASPTLSPSMLPSVVASSGPSVTPSTGPTAAPSSVPSGMPSVSTSNSPSMSPTTPNPTPVPTPVPSPVPTNAPIAVTNAPTVASAASGITMTGFVVVLSFLLVTI